MIFLNNPFAQKEYLVGNIDEGYIIAPGDVLRIVVFGDNTLQLEVKVDLNGNINIPNFGMLMISGSSFANLKTRLKTYLGKYFSGLLSSPQRTFLDVSLLDVEHSVFPSPFDVSLTIFLLIFVGCNYYNYFYIDCIFYKHLDCNY